MDGREMEREVLPSPRAAECALMHSGREHTVSPESERERRHAHADFSHYHRAAF